MLDLKRRLKAVGDVLHAVIWDGVTLARSLELTVQLDGILRIGSVFPFTLQDFDMARSGGLGVWLKVVDGLLCRLLGFIYGDVVHRREEAIRGWRNWLREDPLVHSDMWLRPDLVPPAFFLQCDPLITPVVLGFWLIRARLMRNSEELGFPTFAALGRGRP